MKHAIILGHPGPDSFNHAVARTYEAAVKRLGHQAVLRDLYAMGFDPCLKASERPDHPDHAPGDDVVAERAVLVDVDVFAFVYPLWFNTPPAIIKGYVDRVFGGGFGYGAGVQTKPRLSGRRMISFTSSGSSKAWLEEQGCWLSLRNLFDEYLARVCGMTVADHVHFASVTPGLKSRWVEEHLATVDAKVKVAFGAHRRV